MVTAEVVPELLIINSKALKRGRTSRKSWNVSISLVIGNSERIE